MARRTGLYDVQFWETGNGRGHWTRVHDDLLDSIAYINLSPDAKILYVYLKREYKGAFNKVKDTVTLPYTQATRKIGISRSKMNVCLYELERFGFIELKSCGGLLRTPNQYTFLPKWKYISEKDVQEIKKDVKEYRKKYRRDKAGFPTGLT